MDARVHAVLSAEALERFFAERDLLCAVVANEDIHLYSKAVPSASGLNDAVLFFVFTGSNILVCMIPLFASKRGRMS